MFHSSKLLLCSNNQTSRTKQQARQGVSSRLWQQLCFPPVDLPSADHPTIALLPSTTTIPIIATLSLSLYTLGSFYERILIQKEKRIQLLQYREELFYIDNKMVLILSTIYTFSINPSDWAIPITIASPCPHEMDISPSLHDLISKRWKLIS